MGAARSLIVPRAVADAMLAHARAGLPNEACGLLAGRRAERRVATFHPARNEDASPWRFSVHRQDLVGIVLDIEARGDDLVAIFHSHVSGSAQPSATDVREAAAYPGVLHIVASLTGSTAELRAWDISDGGRREVGLGVG